MPSEQKIIVIPDGKICDYIDGKFRNDTPEEYVRQTIEKRLVNEHKYLPEQIRIEYTLQVGSNKPRADIVIWEEGADQTQGTIKLIIECKKETVDARNAKDGIAQLKSYMSVCPNCEWGMWTNSVQKYVFRKAVDAAGNITFMEYNDIPAADGNLDEVNRPSRTSLKNAYDDNLLFVFKTCHNHIYVNDGMQKQPAFFELLKVIFCKIEDERNIPNPLEFYTTSEERSNPDGQLTVQKRIGKIFQRVKKRHGKIFDANDEIKLSPRSLAYIVSELQRYSLLNTKIDIKGKAYEEIVGANLRGDRGEFFTPRNVMKMVVEMVNPQVDEHVLDSSCGTGGFLVMAMTHVIDQLEQRFSTSLGIKRENWDSDTLRAFQDRISEMASSNYFGFDINPDLVKATKMNMVMNNDGSGNILQTNSLLPPHEWYDDFRSRLAEALGINKNTLRNHSSIGYIGEFRYRDVIVPDGIPAIVPQDLFDRVQEKLAKNKKAPARHKAEDDYLLTTKLFCGYCGAYLCGESGTSRTGKVHHYYKCVSVKKKRTECHKKPVRKEWIEDLVVGETMKMVMDDKAIEAIVSMLMDLQDRDNVNVPLYEQQLREAETAISNLLNAIQQGILTRSTKERLEELENRRDELENRLACEKLAKPKVSAEFMTFWLHRFRKLDVRQQSHRKMLIDTFINAIFLYDDKMVITFNYKEGTKTITFAELQEAISNNNGSDLDCIAAPY